MESNTQNIIYKGLRIHLFSVKEKRRLIYPVGGRLVYTTKEVFEKKFIIFDSMDSMVIVNANTGEKSMDQRVKEFWSIFGDEILAKRMIDTLINSGKFKHDNSLPL